MRAPNAYEGERPRSAVAVLKVDIIGSVDGRPSMEHRFLSTDYVNEIWLLPGKHTVNFTYWRQMEPGPALARLWFVAQPGKTYIGMYSPEQGIENSRDTTIRFWIEEAESHKRVGGIEGSLDEPK
jgi:hypothetical protein